MCSHASSSSDGDECNPRLQYSREYSLEKMLRSLKLTPKLTSEFSDMDSLMYDNGTVTYALRILSGEIFFGSDSRSMRIDDPEHYLDYYAKVQIIGHFFILPSGSSFFARMVLDQVRSHNLGHTNLQTFKNLVVREIGLALKSKKWLKFANDLRISTIPINSFIIGSVEAKRNGDNAEFKESQFVTVYSHKVTEDLNDVLAVGGDGRAIKNHLRDINWADHSSLTDVRRLLVESMAHAYADSISVGGPIDFFSIRPVLDSDGEVMHSQRHELIIPELFFAENNIDFDRHGEIAVDVSNEWLYIFGISRDDIRGQVGARQYSHPVQTLLNYRINYYNGEKTTVQEYDNIIRDLSL